MYFKKAFQNIVLRLLNRYLQDNAVILRCYIRHSMALEPQNPFLSDFDLTFFVDCRDVYELQRIYQRINKDLAQRALLRRLAQDIIVLPATQEAYDLCARYYPFRSIYPMLTWLLLPGKQKPQPIKIDYTLPLDHAPENGLFYYVIPALRRQKPRHIFESLLIKRLIKKDSLFAGIQNSEKHGEGGFFKGLLAEIDIWAKFYKNLIYSDQGQELKFDNDISFDYAPFNKRLNTIRNFGDNFQGASSIWIYPSSINGAIPNLALNFKPTATAQQCRRVIDTTIKAFEGLGYNLILGREESMIARINGLSRLNLLEPWLFEYCGKCLWGAKSTNQAINKPTIGLLKKKYNEFLFYFFYGCLIPSSYDYDFYKLCFTMDYLFKKSEIILNEDKLSGIYGSEFIGRSCFDCQKHTPSLLLSLEKYHRFYILHPREEEQFLYKHNTQNNI